MDSSPSDRATRPWVRGTPVERHRYRGTEADPTTKGPEREWRDRMVEVYADRVRRLFTVYQDEVEIPASERLF